MTLTTLPRFKITSNLSAWRGGAGPNIFLVHGVGLNADAWYAMLPELVQHFTVTVVDMPGHGQSDGLNGQAPGTLGSYTSLVAQALKTCDGAAIIIGHSMGALVAMDLAINYPKLVCGVVALNAVYRRSDQATVAVKERAEKLAMAKKVDNFHTLERWFGSEPHGSSQIAARCCEDILSRTNIAAYADAYSVFANNDGPNDAELAVSSTPMLFITGGDEPNSTPAMSHALADIVLNGTSMIVDGAKHMMPMTHAKIVNHHILEFVNAIGDRDG